MIYSSASQTNHASESPEGLVKSQLLGPSYSQSFNSVSWGWSLRICISIKLPGDANALSWDPYF